MKIIGQQLPRLDARERAAGMSQFTMDISLPNMLWGKVCRSNYSHARILRVDTSKAERVPGVKSVITAADAPTGRFGTWLKDETIFAVSKVRHIGQPIAAVAAIDEDIADEAVDLIEVEYEPLPAVFDPIEAMQPDAPIIHEDLDSYEPIPGFPARKYGNVASHCHIEQGSVEKGFQEADYVFEDTFRTQMQHQCYLEPHVAVATIDFTGKVTVWTSTQTVFMLQVQLADVLKIPMNKIRVVAPAVGGGFGGKLDIINEPLCVLLARKARRPVKIAMTREEEFTSANPRHPVISQIRTGVKKDGTIVAREAKLIFDSGAYANQGPGVTSYGSLMVRGPYRIPNVKVNSYLVYTNKTVAGGFRGFGNPQVTWGGESQIDIIAHKLGIDPVEFRLKNALDKGDRMVTGQVIHSVGLKECIKRAAEAIGWGTSPEGKNRGLGIACMHHTAGVFSSAAMIKMNEDGTVTMLVGTADQGAGQYTVLSQIAAEELSVPLGHVSVSGGDTEATPYDWATCASRTTYNMGNAVRRAAIDAKQQLRERAAKHLEANVEDLECKDSKVSVKGSPERAISYAEIVAASHFVEGGPIIGKGTFFSQDPPFDPKVVVEGMSFAPFPTFIFGTQAAEVEVDPETGKVTVLRMASAHDVGTAINPMAVEGQIEGALATGLGYGLTEEIRFREGVTMNSSFLDYKIATAMDMPKIEPIIVEAYDETGPFGAKGVGEPALVPTAPCIGNAVYNAVGARVTTLPITQERVLSALREKGEQ